MFNRLLAVFLVVFSLSSAGEITGKVVKVYDGDTLTMMAEGVKKKVRFYGIDAPEKSQAYGVVSRDYARDRVLGKMVRVDVVTTDRYGRIVGKIYYGDTYLNGQMVATGNAWWYEKYSSSDMDLMRKQESAREMGAGLWSQEDPQAPWDYRHRGSADTPEVSGEGIYVTKNGRKYHRKGCIYLKSVKRVFQTEKEAEAAGYTPCSRY